jgi:RNA polymerase sigma-70 factor (ECF subfamily)
MPRRNEARSETEFEQAYFDHFSRIHSFLRIYLRNASVADDLAQDTFLQLWSQPGAFDPGRGGLRAYLLGIARKKAADWWRHSKPEADAPPDKASQFSGNTLAIKDALARLDSDLRNVLWLREAEGYSYEELAQILDIPPGTVKSRLFAARKQLREIWQAK